MQEKSIIKKRILQYIDKKNITKYKFYQKTGITRGILDQNNGMSEENIARFIAYAPDINIEWLMTGKGEMFNISNSYSVISEPIISCQTKPLVESRAIPLLTMSNVSKWKEETSSIVDESNIKEYYFIPKFNNRNIDFMIEVSGKSMYPMYNAGDIVACTVLQANTFIQWGRVYIIGTYDQGILIKRLYKSKHKDGSIECHSENSQFPPFEIQPGEITKLALVVGVIRLE